jgi:hypothetical protein
VRRRRVGRGAREALRRDNRGATKRRDREEGQLERLMESLNSGVEWRGRARRRAGGEGGSVCGGGVWRVARARRCGEITGARSSSGEAATKGSLRDWRWRACTREVEGRAQAGGGGTKCGGGARRCGEITGARRSGGAATKGSASEWRRRA